MSNFQEISDACDGAEEPKFVRKYPRETDPDLQRFFEGAYYDQILVADVSAHAFRLWHCIKRHSSRGEDCFPGQRILRKMMNCSPNSLQGWVRELESKGWLHVVEKARKGKEVDGKKKQGVRHVYTILNGHGKPLRDVVSVKKKKTVTADRNSSTATTPRNRSVTKDRIVSKTSNETRSNKGPRFKNGGLSSDIASSESAALRPSRFADAAGDGAATVDENSPENLEALWK